MSDNQSNILQCLYSDSLFADVTLVTDDKDCFKAHRFLLRNSSELFKNIFDLSTQYEDWLILDGISSSELKGVLDFIYKGTFQSSTIGVKKFEKTARYLQLRGVNGGEFETCNEEESEELLKVEREYKEFEAGQYSMESHLKENSSDKVRKLILTGLHEKEIKESKQNSYKQQKTFPDEDRNFPCNQCSYKGTTKRVLKDHVKVKHEGVKFPCDKCPYVSLTKTTFFMHRRTKHENVKFECMICDKEFATPSSLRKHKKYTHEGIRQNCDMCDYSGPTLQTLKFHKAKVHEQ